MPKHRTKSGLTWNQGKDDETGDEWIEISLLDADDCIVEELAFLILRNAKEAEREFPGIHQQPERHAKTIIGALIDLFKNHGLIG